MATKSTQPNENEKRIKIDDLMKKLAKQRPVFYSEADFQFALGWLIQKKYPKYKVRFEYSPSFDRKMHIDILVITDDQKWIPIELKYKTQSTKEPISWNEEEYTLSNHGAKNENCYRYVKDIQRIEEVAENEPTKFIEGYAIMLTNLASYKEEPLKKDANYSEFSIHNDRPLKGTLNWKDKSKANKDMKESIELKGEYHMEWHDYGNSDPKFWYLVSEIKKEGL